MSKVAALYPPSPRDVPPDLTAPSADYQLRVVLVLFSLLLFFFFYLALVAGLGFVIVLCFVKIPFPGSLIVSLPAGLFLLFLIKGFFKRSQVEKSLQIEVTQEQQPLLFAFIRKLCAETDAPLPHRVYLSPEVNASVFYKESIFNLFLPTPKNLLVGLGHVNVLNLSEFKAVLAHEFGHFSQSSMKLNAYVYRANRIVGDLVFGRDWFDDMVDHVCHSDARIAVFGWVAWAILWLFRKTLAGCYYAINLLNLSLSRQMEFNADAVAVSVAGSDAMVHSLSRLAFATDALMQAFEDLKVAAQHQLYTEDLFYHQNHAASYLRRLRKDAHLGEPPPVPDDADVTVEIFEPGDEGIPPMWSTHPSNYDREQNAKDPYVRCPLDDRSPWELFAEPKEVRAAVTWKFYRVAVELKKKVVLADPEAVQSFIDDEHAETTYDPRYKGLYDCRFIEPGDLAKLIDTAKTKPWKAEQMIEVHNGLFKGQFKERMEEDRLLRQEFDLLSGLKNGDLQLEKDTFEFRGKKYDMDDVRRLWKKVDRELEEHGQWLAGLDRKVFLTYYQMARELGKKYAEELTARYGFHLAQQKIGRNLLVQQSSLEAALRYIQGTSKLNSDEFREVNDIFREAHKTLTQSLRTADRLLVPELKNMTAGEPLGYFLMEKKLVAEFRRYSQSISGKKVATFLQQMNEVQEKVKRIHFKSMGAILALQERIGKKWMEELAEVPEVKVVEPQKPPVKK